MNIEEKDAGNSLIRGWRSDLIQQAENFFSFSENKGHDLVRIPQKISVRTNLLQKQNGNSALLEHLFCFPR